ncbi:MAG: hypothetical protein NXY57DRAFT_970374 [Lentinula lateritia]|nr:MAG: hypothetical protein NXY57DRAFT_970374 [Lentinula lateritia]
MADKVDIYRIPVQYYPETSTCCECEVTLLDPKVQTPPDLLKSGKLPGMVVMIDGVALEEVCHYDSVRDSIVGICREHCGKIKLWVDSYEAQ